MCCTRESIYPLVHPFIHLSIYSSFHSSVFVFLRMARIFSLRKRPVWPTSKQKHTNANSFYQLGRV